MFVATEAGLPVIIETILVLVGLYAIAPPIPTSKVAPIAISANFNPFLLAFLVTLEAVDGVDFD